MGQSSLITTTGYRARQFHLLKQLIAALDTSTGHSHDGTDSRSISASVTLDQAYDSGGAGAGRAITVDSGAVALTNNAANNNNVLEVGKSPAGAQSGSGIRVTMGVNATGAGISFAHAGAGATDILGSGSAWSITAGGVGVFTEVDAAVVALVEGTAPAGTVCYLVRDNTGDVTVNALTGKEVHIAINNVDILDIGSGVEVKSGGLLVTLGGTTITAGGLTINAGGANIEGSVNIVGATAIVGDTAITGNLAVSGNLSFGGNWTVGNTLTVDELILDTDGAAPAGTNCYLVRDNAGDLTANTITGKQFIVAINNVDEYAFSATILDMNANALDNCGFLILNAATAPAGTEVYLVNDQAGDLTLNSLTGKTLNLAIAGTDEIQLGETNYLFNQAGADRNFRVRAGIAYAIYSDGGKNALVLGSNTDTSSADQLITVSRAARTATATVNYYDLAIVPAGAVTVPAGVTALVAEVYIAEPNITATGTVTLACTVYIAGAPTEGTTNYALDVAAGATNLAGAVTMGSTLDVTSTITASAGVSFAAQSLAGTTGNLTLSGAGYISVGASPADAGYLRLSNNVAIAWRNQAGAANVTLTVNTSDVAVFSGAVTVGATLQAGTLSGGVGAAGDLILNSTSHATKGCVTIADGEEGIKIGGVTNHATPGTNVLTIFNGTAPVGAHAGNAASLYADLVAATYEMFVMDSGGTATQISPHDADGYYYLSSYIPKRGMTVRIHLEKLVRRLAEWYPDGLAEFVEELQGNQLTMA